MAALRPVLLFSSMSHLKLFCQKAPFILLDAKIFMLALLTIGIAQHYLAI